MFVDASAICASILREDDWNELVVRLERAIDPTTSPPAVWESVVSISRRNNLSPADAQAVVAKFLSTYTIMIAAVPPEAASLAVEAFERFGKGRHPAGLNFGDCFAYACARHLRVPLLFKGNDFGQTDIEIA